MLLAIGRWLEVNGEAIYGTRPWRVYGEGPTEVPEGAFTDTNRAAFTAQDFRFTTKGNDLYAICLDWPGASATIRSLATSAGFTAKQIIGVHMLGVDQPLTWSIDDTGLHVTLPAEKPCEHAYTLRIQLRD